MDVELIRGVIEVPVVLVFAHDAALISCSATGKAEARHDLRDSLLAALGNRVCSCARDITG